MNEKYRIAASSISDNGHTMMEIRKYDGRPRLRIMLVSLENGEPVDEWELMSGDDYHEAISTFVPESRKRGLSIRD